MSPTVQITLDTSALRDFAASEVQAVFQEELRAASTDIGAHVSERVQGIIIEKGIRYTSELLGSITWSLIEETAGVLGVAVGTNVLYGKYQEYGTVPHFVPFHLAKTLYDQAISDWGWIKVDRRTKAYREAEAEPSPGRGRTQNGLLTITTRRFGPKRTNKTYVVDKYPERLWLKPGPDARPAWGVVVSGKKQPFLWPGWEASVEYCEDRLNEAVERAAARLGG